MDRLIARTIKFRNILETDLSSNLKCLRFRASGIPNCSVKPNYGFVMVQSGTKLNAALSMQ